MSEDKSISIQDRRVRRRRFLEILYEWTEGDPGSVVNLNDIGEEMGLTHGEAWDLRMFLGREQVLQGVTSMGGISITQKGVMLYERLHAGPDEVFGGDEDDAGDVHNYGDVHVTAANAQVQQGTSDSSQSMTVSQQTVGDVKSFMDELASAIENLESEGLEQDAAAELNAQVLTAQGQLASKTPRWDVIKNALGEIRDVLDAAKEIGATVAPWVAKAGALFTLL